ncbi:unnamed protein product [Ilex paraguariensis]|uniref:Cyclin C-terminal domain-containing protein n=1 Tax=Ilex paraguariensis TaxID=185542 RepID=A0ABC8SWA2_9AQUA
MDYFIRLASDEESQHRSVQQLFQQESEHMAAEGFSQNQTAFFQRKRAMFFIREEDPTHGYLEIMYNINLQKLREIQRMEFLIISALDWRLRSITPLCFLGFFISLLNINDQHSEQVLKFKAEKIVFRMHRDIEYTQFKPSIIAASAVLAIAKTMARYSDFKEAILSSNFVNRGDLKNCKRALMVTLITDSLTVTSALLSPDSPSSPPPAYYHEDTSDSSDSSDLFDDEDTSDPFDDEDTPDPSDHEDTPDPSDHEDNSDSSDHEDTSDSSGPTNDERYF